MNGYIQSIPIKHVFTSDEIEQLGRDLAREEITLKQTLDDFSKEKSEWNKKINSSRDIISELSTNIEAGEVTKEIECEIQMNAPKEGKKTCTPIDGGKSFVIDMEDDDYAILT